MSVALHPNEAPDAQPASVTHVAPSPTEAEPYTLQPAQSRPRKLRRQTIHPTLSRTSPRSLTSHDLPCSLSTKCVHVFSQRIRKVRRVSFRAQAGQGDSREPDHGCSESAGWRKRAMSPSRIGRSGATSTPLNSARLVLGIYRDGHEARQSRPCADGFRSGGSVSGAVAPPARSRCRRFGSYPADGVHIRQQKPRSEEICGADGT